MKGAWSAPAELIVVGAVLLLLCACVLPTCLYLYVEPRGRLRWSRSEASPSPRRAPRIVRGLAWSTFLVAELAVPFSLVTAACTFLLYVQIKLGLARPLGLLTTVVVGATSLFEAVLALALVPLGVRLLVGDPKAVVPLRRHAKANAFVMGVAFALTALIEWMSARDASLVHPWLRAALLWSAFRPMLAGSAVGLLHAFLLGQGARALAREQASAQPPR